MTERPTARIIDFPTLRRDNPYYIRAYWIFNEMYDLTEVQAERVAQLAKYKFSWENLADQNEIMTIKVYENISHKSERPSKIYKIPEYTAGREYLKHKNNQDPLIDTTWVELDDGNDHSDVNEILNSVEDALGIETAQVTNINQGFVRNRVMNPHISKTIRGMIGIPRQKVVNTAANK